MFGLLNENVKKSPFGGFFSIQEYNLKIIQEIHLTLAILWR